MYDTYSKALAVLEVLEAAERALHRNRSFRLVWQLKRKGLFMEKSVSYLLDALRPNEALRFRNAMATIESHFVRLSAEDRDFIRQEGPATTGFYLAYLEDHHLILSIARRIFLGERTFTGINPELVGVAGNLVASAEWVAKVLIPSIDPRLRGPIESRLKTLLFSAEQALEGTPAPESYKNQIQRLNLDLNRMQYA